MLKPAFAKSSIVAFCKLPAGIPNFKTSSDILYSFEKSCYLLILLCFLFCFFGLSVFGDSLSCRRSE